MNSAEIHNPCVGIIIPIYNVAPYLRECLDSVINQTYQNLQIVLVDDGSTDESYSIAKEYFKRDERIILIKKDNGGAGSARNIALDYFLQNSWGGGIEIHNRFPCQKVEYVHFLDSDDWLELNCIEECVCYLQKNNVDILIYDGKNIFQSKNDGLIPKSFLLSTFTRQEGLFSNYNFFNIVKDNLFLTTCCQFRLELLKNIRFEEGIMIEDMIFGPIVAYRAKAIGLLNKQLYCRRNRADSISSIANKDQAPLNFMRDIVDELGSDRGRLYFYCYSNVLVCFTLYQYFFMQKECIDTKILDRINQVIRKRIPMAFYTLHFESDPRGAREKLNNLKNYLQYVGWSSKLAYYCPNIFRILRKIKNIIKK